ncbi:hypothetical protein MKEN_01150800 [Mycena kentingensis (nom. inval.)]|nr:hypothetical protein MKEN_01150800 [Mycena kentingensis (nom. inval.)]
MVPPELCASIVEHLYNDNDSLKSCSLASSGFREPAQKHLLSTLVLGDDRHAFSDAAARFSDAPRLGGLVSSLVVNVKYDEAHGRDASAALQHLTHVETCTIVGPHNPDWDAIPADLAAAIVAWLTDPARRASLRHLKLAKIDNFPLVVFGIAPSLHFESLHIKDDGEDNDEPLAEPEVPITSLHVTESRDASSLLLTEAFYPYIEQLRSLIVESSRAGTSQVDASLVAVIHKTVEYLEIEATILGPNERLQCFTYGLPDDLPRLQHLRVGAALIAFQGGNSSLSGVLDVVLKPGCAPLLTELTIRADLQDRSIILSPMRRFFAYLDRLFSQHSTLEIVRWVPTYRFMDPDSDEDSEGEHQQKEGMLTMLYFIAFETAIRDLLPKTREKGLLRVEEDGSE